jgi:hypothetical protein
MWCSALETSAESVASRSIAGAAWIVPTLSTRPSPRRRSGARAAAAAAVGALFSQ